MVKIQSGAGKSYELKINKKLQAHTLATTQTTELEASLEGDSFFANTTDTADTLTVTTTGGPMIYIKNTSTTQDLVIAKLIPTTDQAATVLTTTREPTLAAIGNNNTHTPVNINMGSAKSASATIYNWDESGNGMTGLSGGTKIATYILAVGTTVLPLDDSHIIPPGTSMMFSLKSIGTSSECSLNVRFHYRDFSNGS